MKKKNISKNLKKLAEKISEKSSEPFSEVYLKCVFPTPTLPAIKSMTTAMTSCCSNICHIIYVQRTR